jgi:hypothetical protein
VRFTVVSVALSSLFVFNAVSQQAPPSGRVGTAIIWRDPGNIETRDTYWGMGHESRQPTAPFKYVREKTSGSAAKVVVTDATGRGWDVKFGPEAHAETAASRLVWALGYITQEMYYLPAGVIEGATNLERAQKYIEPDGKFSQARFRIRDENIVEAGGWALTGNPFVGTPELSGLILLMALINNWDTADTTNKEIHLVTPPGEPQEQWYTIPDLGASFGRFVGPQGTPIKWFLPAFQQDKFIQRVEGDTVFIDYQAYGQPPQSVPLEHARWFASLAGGLQEWQIRRVFESAGATPEEQHAFTAKLLEKIGELQAAVSATR